MSHPDFTRTYEDDIESLNNMWQEDYFRELALEHEEELERCGD